MRVRSTSAMSVNVPKERPIFRSQSSEYSALLGSRKDFKRSVLDPRAQNAVGYEDLAKILTHLRSKCDTGVPMCGQCAANVRPVDVRPMCGQRTLERTLERT